ncbi:MAG: biotin-dependent carboxyltransferase [Thermoanaerobacteraceae bacterium]|nr:biotin-dependent carboxyltransferase [Thermoanaerobacteraceae bacterium]
MGIMVHNPGLLTTVQDAGRFGYQHIGMPTAGVMDFFAYQAANRLVGNSSGEAVLECTLVGPTLEFTEDALVAVTGGDLSPQLDGMPLPMWESCLVSRGSKLSFQGVRSGARAYIAVAGGIDVPLVMGSRSTYLRGKLGGLEGRKLRQGDYLPVGKTDGRPSLLRVKPDCIPDYSRETVRVVLGPQDDYFTSEGIKTFLNETYEVTKNSDRMGYRLTGPTIEHGKGADIISDGIPLGGIQVPGHGEPIIMMVDRQTTGGYPKIATVITPDISLVAQKNPGDRIKFAQVTLEEAQEIYRSWMERLDEAYEPKPEGKRFKVTISGHVYDVLVEEI